MNTHCNILGYKITTLCVKDLVELAFSNGKLTIINTLNPHSYVESKHDPIFEAALKNSDFLIPDGSGISLAEKIIHGKKINKIAGYDLFKEIMQKINLEGGKVFFLGSSNDVLSKITHKARKEYPNVEVKTLSPPYKSIFNEEDITTFVESICAFKPEVLFVGLTAPKQEKLILQIRGLIDAKVVSGIGAVFDFYAGTVKRPNHIWIKLHLEWLVRFLGDPRRLWKRNFISTPLFLIDVIKCKARL